MKACISRSYENHSKSKMTNNYRSKTVYWILTKFGPFFNIIISSLYLCTCVHLVGPKATYTPLPRKASLSGPQQVQITRGKVWSVNGMRPVLEAYLELARPYEGGCCASVK